MFVYIFSSICIAALYSYSIKCIYSLQSLQVSVSWCTVLYIRVKLNPWCLWSMLCMYHRPTRAIFHKSNVETVLQQIWLHLPPVYLPITSSRIATHGIKKVLERLLRFSSSSSFVASSLSVKRSDSVSNDWISKYLVIYCIHVAFSLVGTYTLVRPAISSRTLVCTFISTKVCAIMYIMKVCMRTYNM